MAITSTTSTPLQTIYNTAGSAKDLLVRNSGKALALTAALVTGAAVYAFSSQLSESVSTVADTVTTTFNDVVAYFNAPAMNATKATV